MTLRRTTGRKVERALLKAALFLLRQSQKLVPVDTGALRASAHVRQRGHGYNTVTYVVYLTDYAIYVHEDLTKYHKPPTQAKFVETPARRDHLRILAIIRRELVRP
jgi:hypothetical protein